MILIISTPISFIKKTNYISHLDENEKVCMKVWYFYSSSN